MKVNKKWLSGVENPEEFEKKMLEQKELFKQFYDLVEMKIKANDKDKLRKDNYDSPNWAQRQADSIGYNRALTEIKALLNYTQE